MSAKKRAAPRKALPTNWNLEQLDEELRVALGLTKRPGVRRNADAPPQIETQQRERTQGRGAKRRIEIEEVPWTEAQRETIYATMAAHVADPLWSEKADVRFIRLILTDADFDNALDNVPTQAQLVVVVRKLIRSVRALARAERGEAQ